jgi:hypothetical protein
LVSHKRQNILLVGDDVPADSEAPMVISQISSPRGCSKRMGVRASYRSMHVYECVCVCVCVYTAFHKKTLRACYLFGQDCNEVLKCPSTRIPRGCNEVFIYITGEIFDMFSWVLSGYRFCFVNSAKESFEISIWFDPTFFLHDKLSRFRQSQTM